MKLLLAKYLITALVVVVVSEIARRTDKLGALIAAMPIVTVMVMIWLYVEKQGTEKISNHALYTFWYVLPTLPMFLVMPKLLSRGISFWLALAIGLLITAACFGVTALVAKGFGVDLFL